MAANTAPIFSIAPDIQWINSITAANTNTDITSGTSYLVFTADATNGGWLREVRIKAAPGNNTAATVARLWINNGSNPTSAAANSVLFTEATVPATTASSSAALFDIVIPMNVALPAGYKIYLTIGTAPGGSGAFAACAVAGKY